MADDANPPEGANKDRNANDPPNVPPAADPKTAAQRNEELRAKCIDMSTRAIRAIVVPGDVIELRAFDCTKYPKFRNGYFDDATKLASAAYSLSHAVKASLVAVTINPVNPDLLARGNNSIVECKRGDGAGDRDVIARRNLFFDFDPHRLSGIPANDAEHNAGLVRRDEAHDYLSSLGFPEPLVADSGNGGHLVYAIDLPNDDASSDLVAATLAAMKSRFSDTVVEIDASVGNASRLWRLPGTVNRKGTGAGDRKHRYAFANRIPETRRIVQVDLLRKLAESSKPTSVSFATSPEKSSDTADVRERAIDPPGSQAAGPVTASSSSANGDYDRNVKLIEDFLRENGIPTTGSEPWKGGRLWQLVNCPFDQHSENGKAFIAVLPTGALSAGCQKDGCSTKRWEDLKSKHAAWFEARSDRRRKDSRNQRARDKRANDAAKSRADEERHAAAVAARDAYALMCEERLLGDSSLLARLADRGISELDAKNTRLGWTGARADRDRDLEAMEASGHSKEAIQWAGLLDAFEELELTEGDLGGRLLVRCEFDGKTVGLLAFDPPGGAPRDPRYAILEIKDPDAKDETNAPSAFGLEALNSDLDDLLVVLHPLDAILLRQSGHPAIAVAHWKTLGAIESGLTRAERVTLLLPHHLHAGVVSARNAAIALEQNKCAARLAALEMPERALSALTRHITAEDLRNLAAVEPRHRLEATQRLLAGRGRRERAEIEAALFDAEAQTVLSEWARRGELSARIEEMIRAAKPPTRLLHPTIEPNDDYVCAHFAQMHGSDVRFAATKGPWLHWDGVRWKIDAEGRIYDLLTDAIEDVREPLGVLVDSARIAKDKTFDPQLVALYGRLCKASTLGSLETHVSRTARDPRLRKLRIPLERFDVPETTGKLLNTPSGVLDLRCRKLIAHADTKDLLITTLCPTRFDPNAECPRWIAALNGIFEADRDPERAARLIETLQIALGHSLFGEQLHHVIVLLYGPEGRNGKSFIVRVIEKMLGPDFAAPAPPGLFKKRKFDGHPTEFADLRGKRFLTIVETAKGEAVNEALLKSLSGGDTVKGRLVCENFFSFQPSFHLFIATNFLPTADATDQALWSRFRILPFRRRFLRPGDDGFDPNDTACHVDPGLEAFIVAHELPGVLSWCVEGARRFLELGGVPSPPESTLAVKEYRGENDVIAQFLEERCEISGTCSSDRESGDPSARVPANALYSEFEMWTRSRGEESMTANAFGRALTQKGFPNKRDSTGAIWFRCGLRLRSKSDAGAKDDVGDLLARFQL